MKEWRRRGFLLGCCGAALLAGCNFPSNVYFLMPEAKDPAEYKKLANADNKKKEVKVVVWTYMGLDLRPEIAQTDRQMAAKVAEQIQHASKENDENVTVVKPSLVEQYKSMNPDWRSIDLMKVGHYFKADYVISLEINEFSLYAPKTNYQLYRGWTHIYVSWKDVNNPDDSPDEAKEFTDRWPVADRVGLDTRDLPVGLFKEKFLGHVAKRLALKFVDHAKRDREMDMDS